jgi:hypothetical protein
MRRLAAILLGCVLILAGCIPIGDAWFRFDGVVSDPSGRAVEGAKITILVNDKPLEHGGSTSTDTQGHYEFFESACPCEFAFTLNASAPGFKPFALHLNAMQAIHLTKQDIILHRQ